MSTATETAPAINLVLGQRVTIISKHCLPGTTGKVERLALDYSGDGGHEVPMATVLLDKYIQLPASTLGDGYQLHATTICRQTVPVDEVLPWDFRDAAIASLRDAVDLLEKLAPESWQFKSARELLERLGTMEKETTS
jgi:hypothetical protein